MLHALFTITKPIIGMVILLGCVVGKRQKFAARVRVSHQWLFPYRCCSNLGLRDLIASSVHTYCTLVQCTLYSYFIFLIIHYFILTSTLRVRHHCWTCIQVKLYKFFKSVPTVKIGYKKASTVQHFFISAHHSNLLLQ